MATDPIQVGPDTEESIGGFVIVGLQGTQWSIVEEERPTGFEAGGEQPSEHEEEDDDEQHEAAQSGRRFVTRGWSYRHSLAGLCRNPPSKSIKEFLATPTSELDLQDYPLDRPTALA
jgi:hypothetical protein